MKNEKFIWGDEDENFVLNGQLISDEDWEILWETDFPIDLDDLIDFFGDFDEE